MGSFVGHIDEAIFFLLLAFWWMLNKFVRYIKCNWERTEYTTRVSYPLPTHRYIPLEAILKTLFPLAGVAVVLIIHSSIIYIIWAGCVALCYDDFSEKSKLSNVELGLIGEVFSEGPSLLDEDGNFRKLAQMQHMSIYGIFIAHGIIDILMSYGVPLPKGTDFLSAGLCFFWYGLSFSFHAHMHGKEAVETMIHILPVYIMYAAGLSGLFEMMLPHCFMASLARIFCLLVLGTWFVQAAFVMYIPYPWPGSNLNPRWDQQDERNVHAIVAIFGYHLILNMLVILFVYLAIYAVMKAKRGLKWHFRPLVDQDDSDVRRDCNGNSNQFVPLLEKSSVDGI